MAEKDKSEAILIEAHSLQKLIGLLGISLPIILGIGSYLINDCKIIQGSISDYYHTEMRTYFTGTLCAFGVCLFAYKGYEGSNDVYYARFASLCAIVTALNPTNNKWIDCPNTPSDVPLVLHEKVHLIAASLFFICLAWISFFIFTKSKAEKSAKKIVRNGIYRTCGIIIILSLIACAVAMQNRDIDDLSTSKIVFVMETIALFAFGTSWLIKGEFILKDAPSKTEVKQVALDE